MGVVPGFVPDTMPLEPILAVDGTPLLQAPPGVISVNAVVVPKHTWAEPDIAAGVGCTVVTAVTTLMPTV